ncbi:dicarboxylate/amino acid:cation symporter [Clostridium sp. CF012]|uniref:dicarboxylate/amino acid:cation symporter n=1 Tax=Clostridium sp. CF012 TaxID=2843319 RepID=UPI001C0B2526|nr:dicarboxylate/amino acid:cation symporter [Clostridium sp. CF012]MBU3146854.1 dicarboxylate/amino acid:cation symporter [Clostridium sp. CF012]
MKKIKKMQLATKVFIGFGLGILLGVIFKEKIMIVKPLGDLFLRLIKMIVVPLVLFSIIGGVASIGDIKKLKRLGSKTLLYYIITTLISGIIGLIVANIINPGKGFSMNLITTGKVEATVAPKFMDTLLNMVPTNPVEALVNANLMQIIIFALFFGVAMTIVGAKAKPIKDFCDAGTEIMYKLTSIVMEFSPIGVTALIATAVGEYGLKIFGPLGKLILADYIGLTLIIVVMYTIMLKFIAKVSIKEFFKHIPEIWAVTASTTSSSGTLPVTIRVTEEKFNVQGELASFTLPLGATMNMNGAANYFAVAVIFVAQIYGIEMSFFQQFMIIILATMISVGAPGIPGGGIVLTIMLLNTMGLPIDIVGLIAGIYRVLDMGHTTLNVTGDVVSTLCIARSENMFKPDAAQPKIKLSNQNTNI